MYTENLLPARLKNKNVIVFLYLITISKGCSPFNGNNVIRYICIGIKVNIHLKSEDFDIIIKIGIKVTVYLNFGGKYDSKKKIFGATD